MKIFLIRHGKSDKSLQETLPHNEFELKRALIDGEAEKATQLGLMLKAKLGNVATYDLIWSGKMRSQLTVLAIAKGLGLNEEETKKRLREDFGLIYLAEKEYWHACEQAVKNGETPSHADFFLANLPQGHTFSAEYMKQNMRAVIRRAIERNTFLGNEVSVMVSHEPVISLCMSDLSGKSVTELGGSSKELEYASFEIDSLESQIPRVELSYRDNIFDVSAKIF